MGIASLTHLGGNSSPVLLNNKGKLTKIQKTMIKEAMKLWKPLEYGVDYQLTPLLGIAFGIEPTYQYDDLLIIYISRNKGKSYIQTGYSFGDWGSGIRSKFKLYREYKNKSKFVKFIDKWHGLLGEDKGIC